MFHYEKKLQFPVKIATPNPKLAAFIISQYGGPDGELGASMRYLSQRYYALCRGKGITHRYRNRGAWSYGDGGRHRPSADPKSHR